MDSRRVLETFLDLVRIYSPSLQEDFVFEYVFKRIRSLGFNSEVQVNGKVKNMIIYVPGNDASKEPIFFCAHADTVEPSRDVKPVVDEENGIIKSSGDTILGADDKAGIAAMIELLHHLVEEPSSRYGDIYLIITSAEEIGLVGVKHLDISNIKAKYGYCLDSHGDIGRAIIKGVTHYRFYIECFGKSSHAGIDPDKGINAIKMAGEIINNIPTGLINDGTVVNIGEIHGGKATNIVPDYTKIEGEVRAFKDMDINSVLNYIEDVCKAVEKKYTSKVKFTSEKLYHGYALEENSPSVRRFVEVCYTLGLKPTLEITRGGCDANILNEKGLETLNISCGMRNPHSVDEYIYINDLIDISKLMIGLVTL